jgi:hypothetical protein
MLYETFIGMHNISILVEGENRPCMLSIRHALSQSSIVEDVFPNAKVLSATLRDTIGLQDAITFLVLARISPNSDLWDLNHSRPFPKMEIMARDDEYIDNVYKPSDDYDLIGQTGWSGYEGSGDYYLYQHRSTMTLWIGERVYPGCGNEPYDNELWTITLSGWNEMVNRYNSEDGFAA